MEDKNYHLKISMYEKCGYLTISNNKVFETKDISVDKTWVYADYDKEGKLVGIEFYGDCDINVPSRIS